MKIIVSLYVVGFAFLYVLFLFVYLNSLANPFWLPF